MAKNKPAVKPYAVLKVTDSTKVLMMCCKVPMDNSVFKNVGDQPSFGTKPFNLIC